VVELNVNRGQIHDIAIENSTDFQKRRKRGSIAQVTQLVKHTIALPPNPV